MGWIPSHIWGRDITHLVRAETFPNGPALCGEVSPPSLLGWVADDPKREPRLCDQCQQLADYIRAKERREACRS